jgi:hypothetical protein
LGSNSSQLSIFGGELGELDELDELDERGGMYCFCTVPVSTPDEDSDVELLQY